jgi:hypothetical protein
MLPGTGLFEDCTFPVKFADFALSPLGIRIVHAVRLKR